MKITTDEILETLRAAMKHRARADGMTMREIAKALDCGPDQARKVVRANVEAGALCPVRIVRANLVGQTQIVWGYAMAAKKNGKK